MAPKYDPELVTLPQDVAKEALMIGGAAAVPGLVYGALWGTIKTRTPVLFSIGSGVQCFGIGFTFWGVRASLLNQTGLLNWWNTSRGVTLQPRDDLSPSPSDKIRASTISGAFTGASLGLLYRGSRNVLPGTLMFTLYGFLGQTAYNYFDARNTAELQETINLKDEGKWKPKAPLVQRMLDSKWSPVTRLTDEQFENILQEKLLKIEAEIAIIDDRIEMWRVKASEVAARNAAEAALKEKDQQQQQQQQQQQVQK